MPCSLQVYLKFSLVCFACAMLSACASMPQGEAPSEQDPWERSNRTFDHFNTQVDRALVKPVAKVYQAVVPNFIQFGLDNFIGNLGEPLVAVNQVLQLKPLESLATLVRFSINSTIGVFGLLDVASLFSLEAANEDFGQTLGYWGVGSGPYLVLPFLGPSTVRDTVGVAIQGFDDCTNKLNRGIFDTSREIKCPTQRTLGYTHLLQRRAQLLQLEKQLDSTGIEDRYALVRDIWLKNRERLVHDLGDEDEDEVDPLDEFDFDELDELDDTDGLDDADDTDELDDADNADGSNEPDNTI